MAYDPVLEERIDEVAPELYSKKMFGGVGYFFDGNMCCGISGEALIVRLGPDSTQELGEGIGHFAPGGKPMKGWFTVEQELIPEDDELRDWIDRGLTFCRTLPPK